MGARAASAGVRLGQDGGNSYSFTNRYQEPPTLCAGPDLGTRDFEAMVPFVMELMFLMEEMGKNQVNM